MRLTELELQRQAVRFLPVFTLPDSNGGRRGLSSRRAREGGSPTDRGPPPRNSERQEVLASLNSPEHVNYRLRNPVVQRSLGKLKENNTYLYARNRQGVELFRSANFPEDLIPPEGARPASPRSGFVWAFTITDSQYYTRHFNPGGGVIVIGRPMASINADLYDLTMKAGTVGLLVLSISSVLGFLLIRYSLKPIREISETAEQIANGNIAERIDTAKVQSELGQMADVLNRTFGRLGEALKRQIQFTSDASHELRTPVAAILADCQFSLKRERSPERYRETIEVCHESAQHMRHLIEDLRDLADFDEKNDSMVSELVDMKEFLSNVVSVMKPLADEKGLVLESQLEDATVYFDPIRMRQAVLNLLSNAVRYTESAGEVIVRCIKEANSVVIEVCDTGIGIAPDKIAHIFDRFYRADAARNAHTGGVGLGLAISKSIVEANGGSISVESKIGRGTCFRIRLNTEA